MLKLVKKESMLQKKKKKKILIADNLLRFIDYLHKFELYAADVGHP